MSRIGCIDMLAAPCVRGWAADDDRWEQTVQVEVVVNSRPVAMVSCDMFREDLLSAGIGNGRHAFQFDPSGCLSPGRNELEVRYAGTEVMVPNGRGMWVKRRSGAISELCAALLAALEAYHEFTPGDRICCFGQAMAELELIFREAGVPFQEFTGAPAQADVVILWDTPRPLQELAPLLKPHALLVLGLDDTAQEGQIHPEFPESRVMLESLAVTPGTRRTVAFIKSGSREYRNAQPPPVLTHLHVPKCAGTSFRAMLERWLGPQHLSLYVNDTYFVYPEEALRNYLLQDPQIRGLTSHHVRTFPHWLAGREMLYVTFLRDPIEQFVSYMTHIKKHYAAITSPSLLAALPPDAPRLGLREFARWLLTADNEIPFRANHNVNFFARHSAPAATDHLQAAKAALGRFFFVGITERMEESVCKLRTLARQKGVDFPPGPVPVENTSADCRDELSWIKPTDDVGALLIDSVDLDRQLYDWAAARMDSLPG